MDYSPPGFSVDGILQARILEEVAIPFSRFFIVLILHISLVIVCLPCRMYIGFKKTLSTLFTSIILMPRVVSGTAQKVQSCNLLERKSACILEGISDKLVSIVCREKVEGPNTLFCYQLRRFPGHKTLLFFKCYFFIITYLFYFWLCWVFVALHGLSLLAVSRGYSCLRCAGFSLRWLLVWSTASRAPELQYCSTQAQLLCSMWNIPRLGIKPMTLHWSVDSYPLHHQGSPQDFIFKTRTILGKMELLVTLGKALHIFKGDGLPFESNQMDLYLDKNKNSHLYLSSIYYRHCASTLNTFSHLISKVTMRQAFYPHNTEQEAPDTERIKKLSQS